MEPGSECGCCEDNRCSKRYEVTIYYAVLNFVLALFKFCSQQYFLCYLSKLFYSISMTGQNIYIRNVLARDSNNKLNKCMADYLKKMNSMYRRCLYCTCCMCLRLIDFIIKRSCTFFLSTKQKHIQKMDRSVTMWSTYTFQLFHV